MTSQDHSFANYKPTRSPVVFAIIVSCVVVSWKYGFPEIDTFFLRASSLTFCEFQTGSEGRIVLPTDLFYSIRQGQIWRLFTPILIHINLVHLILNLVLVVWFCSPIESAVGHLRFLHGVLLLAAISNVTSAVWSPLPFFAGVAPVWCAAFAYRGVLRLVVPASPLAIGNGACVAGTISIALGFFRVVPAADAAYISALVVGAAYALPMLGKSQSSADN